MEARKKIKIEEALQIVYYLMAADGDICQNEEEKFDAIGKEWDEDFKKEKDGIIEKCKEQLDKVIDEEEYYDVIREGVEECLRKGIIGYEWMALWEKDIDGGILVWDLLTIAFSDGKYTEEERKLIKLVTRKLDLDKTLFLEMENSIKAILALDREEAWVKGTNRPYSTIEALIKEISIRRDVIMKNMDELIKG